MRLERSASDLSEGGLHVKAKYQLNRFKVLMSDF